MQDWRKWQVGQRLHYLKDEFDGRTEWYGVVTEKHPDHLIFTDRYYGLENGKIIKDKGTPVQLWIDDYTAEDCSEWDGTVNE